MPSLIEGNLCFAAVMRHTGSFDFGSFQRNPLRTPSVARCSKAPMLQSAYVEMVNRAGFVVLQSLRTQGPRCAAGFSPLVALDVSLQARSGSSMQFASL